MMTRRAFVLFYHPHLRLNGLEFGGDDAICPGMYSDLCREDPSSVGLIFSSCQNYDEDKCRRCWDKQISNKPAKEKAPPVTATLKQALDTYGAEAQTLVAFEEMAELEKELCKHARGRDNRDAIAEEIADVLIMLEQMMLLHDCKDAVADFRLRKIKRLAERLKEEKDETDIT